MARVAAATSARTLRAERIVRSLEELEARIRDRFPTRGLPDLCGELADVSRETARRVEAARRPYHLLRIGVVAVIALAAYGVWRVVELSGAGLGELMVPAVEASPLDLMQAIESAVNLAILAALACWFLVSLETRLTRQSVLSHLHELRSLAHVVDMHQLTKDPVSIRNPDLRLSTSPERDLTLGELSRYLDYCVEMLSLIGKLAALYAEHTQDAQVIDASNDIEDLTTNLSRKIWQKIMLTGAAARAAPSAGGL